MFSECVRAHIRIREKLPLATYTHRSGHCLNLVISHTCGLSVIRNILDKIKHKCVIFEQLLPNGMACILKNNKRLLELDGNMEGSQLAIIFVPDFLCSSSPSTR